MTKEQKEIERLRKEVEYWREAYHKMKEEVDKLSLDLGLKENKYVYKDNTP